MDTITINFKASGQNLTADAHPQRYASNTVNYIQAVFDLDENWQSFDSVRAVWHNDFACISTVLDSDGACAVPHEVLTNLDEVIVNLVGSDVDGEELVDRMTTYPLRVAIIDAHARICGTETVEVTPSQFEQYIAIVEQIVGTVKDIDHTELTDDYCLIIYYSDGTNSGKLGPIRGATGATGNGIVSAVLNSDYTLTLAYDNGDSDTVGPIRGAQGETGNGIQSVYLTETHGAVKTYTILFTDGTTTTFDVTDGEVTLAQLESVLPTDTASGAIASFPDGSDLFDYLSCVVEINPVQDLHGYDSPWVAGGGKNKWSDKISDYSRPNDYYWFPISLEVGETYTWSASRFGSSVTGVTVGIVKDGVRYSEFVTPSPWRLVGNDGNIVESSITFTIDNTWTSPKVVIYAANEETFNNLFANYHLQFEKSATATAWQPYSNICPITGWTGCNVVVSPTEDAQDGTTYPVSWQTEAGTVYGCTVDITNGKIYPWGEYTFTGNETYSTTGAGQHIITSPSVATLGALAPANEVVANIKAEFAEPKSYNSLNVAGETDGIGIGGGSANKYIILGSKQYDARAELVGKKIIFELASPTGIDITPTAISCPLGQNNVWADCGNVEVQYKADVQRWVEKKLGE